MNKTAPCVRQIALASAFASMFSLAPGAAAQTALPPNLTPLPASNLSLVATTTTTTLRFSTTSWNKGTGPLRLEAGSVDTGSGKQQVLQRVYNTDGSSATYSAGWFTYHPTHNHIHFDNYARYLLQPVNAPGGSQRIGQKTTFCVMDTTAVNTSLPGAPGAPGYSTCGNQIQGMSVGWGDTYGAHLAGQEIDFSGNADGIYDLTIEVDPNKLLVEADKNDNASCVRLDIKKPSTVTVFGNGSCSANAPVLVTSISPSTMLANTNGSVTILGSGFAQGMSVTFEGGNGPRPTASNVTVSADGSQISALVAVPYKKQSGRDPVWDVRVGADGLLRNAFTVTR